MFKYLDALLFDPARIEGTQAYVRSTVVIHRDLKKSEIVIEWVLVREGDAWKVLDTVMVGESTFEGVSEGRGVSGMMRRMRLLPVSVMNT